MNRRLVVIAALLGLAAHAEAHPVPSFTYDRTIRVKLSEMGVEVQYRLELTDFTVLRDMDKLVDETKLATLKSPSQLRAMFVEAIAPLLADRLEAWQDDKLLSFRLAQHQCRVEDHLYCDYTFFAPWPGSTSRAFRFRLEVVAPRQREEIHLEKGRLDIALELTTAFTLTDRIEPPNELKDRPETDRDAEDEQRLRCLAATLGPLASEPRAEQSPEELPPAEEQVSVVTDLRRRGMVALLDSHLGLGLLLVLAVVFGAAHALTPGHGKTLVAAYLVGQRGTVGHALLLGLVTTMTHTGIVIILAAILPWLLAYVAPERVQAMLGFVGGLLVAGMGVWLLLRRLSGQADHVHVGGGHHHHHGPGGHHHHHLPSGDRVRIWDLIVLGVSGGIVPCWDAIALLAMAIGTRQVWLGLPLLVAFSAGLAGVLVLIGVLVVKVKGFSTSRRGEGPITRALPIFSAIAVTVLGIWLCVSAAVE